MQFLKEKLEKANAKIAELEENTYQKYEVTTNLLTSFEKQNTSSIKYYLVNQGATGAPTNVAGIVESFKSAGGNYGYLKLTALTRRYLYTCFS